LSGKSSLQARAILLPIRGAFRDRHKRWAQDAVDAAVSKTNDTVSVFDGFSAACRAED
jgi:hypothetical protein